MVANGAMGLLGRRAMTRDPWAMDHGPWTMGLRDKRPPLTCYCVLGSLLWHGRPGMTENGAMGPLCSSSILL